MNAGRELDVLVAEKVMGWTSFKKRWRDGSHFDLLDRFLDSNNIEVEGACPHYSTNIAVAWEVVTRVYKQSNNSEPDFLQITGPLSDGWKVQHIWGHHDGDIPEYFVVRKSLPHAICLAALKAVGHGLA